MSMRRDQDSGSANAAFARVVRLDAVAGKAFDVDLEADRREREAVAKRAGVQEVSFLKLEGALRRDEGRDGHFLLEGKLVAEVTQTCVVSLEPVSTRLRVAVRRSFVQGGTGSQDGKGEVLFDPEGEDPPDLAPDGQVDLGEVATEELVLALDPYPRKPDARLAHPVLASEDGAADVAAEGGSPFAVLGRLKH